MSKAVLLFSGGLDSTTTLAIAKQQGFACYALSLDYGQRHKAELAAATRLAHTMQVFEHKILRVDLGKLGGSALTDVSIQVPQQAQTGIPVTYVPARNTVLLSLALAWAEVLGAFDLFIGVNAVDYSGYPDCRPEFIRAYQEMAQLATKIGTEGAKLQIHTPLIHWSKAQIIQAGTKLGVNYAATVSCYRANSEGHACRICDACRIRAEGFRTAKVADPTRYQTTKSF